MNAIRDMAEGFTRYRRETESRARRGLAQAGMALLQDCAMDIPRVPLDEGTLRGSGSVHVSGKFVGDSSDMAGGGRPTPVTSDIPNQSTADMIEATVGFNTPYAAVQHEGVRHTPKGEVKMEHYSHSGTGAKFEEKKMSANRDRYMGIVARNIRGAG